MRKNILDKLEIIVTEYVAMDRTSGENYRYLMDNLETVLYAIQQANIVEQIIKTADVIDARNQALIQQNEQMKQALKIVRDTLEHKKNEDRTSFSLWQLAEEALKVGEKDELE